MGFGQAEVMGIFPVLRIADASSAPLSASPLAPGEQMFSQPRTEEDHVNVADNATHANSKNEQAPPRAYRPDAPMVKERICGSSTTAKLMASDPIKLQAAREA